MATDLQSLPSNHFYGPSEEVVNVERKAKSPNIILNLFTIINIIVLRKVVAIQRALFCAKLQLQVCSYKFPLVNRWKISTDLFQFFALSVFLSDWELDLNGNNIIFFLVRSLFLVV